MLSSEIPQMSAKGYSFLLNGIFLLVMMVVKMVY